MCGWIKISRNINKHWLWQDAERLKWWLDLLLMANWEDKQVMHDSHLITLKRGQIIASISFLVDRWGASKPTIIKYLGMLEDEKMITREVVGRRTAVITICNYDAYQGFDILIDTNDTSKVDTTKSGQNHDAQPILSGQPISEIYTLVYTLVDTLVDTIKEYKNINNIINNNRARVREENFSEELKKDQMWLEVMAKNHDLQSTQVVADWLDKFDIDNQCRDKSHTDLSDYRRHFNDWLKFKKRNESTKKNKRDGYYEPTATSADDYYNSSF